jgi:hypothetical protein
MIAAEKLKTETPTGRPAYEPEIQSWDTMIQEKGFEKIVQEVMRRIRQQEQENGEIKWLAEHPEYTW